MSGSVVLLQLGFVLMFIAHVTTGANEPCFEPLVEVEGPC